MSKYPSSPRALFSLGHCKTLVGALIGATLLVSPFSPRGTAQSGGLAPSVAFTQGLVGTQVHLQWVAQPGVRYVIQKSPDLSMAGGFATVALVTTEGSAGQWVDPAGAGPKGFYRIGIPVAEVFALEPPVLSTVGGEIFVRGQLLPPGSFLRLDIPGQPPVFAGLVPVAGQPGLWRVNIAGITGGAVAGIVIAARVVDESGAPVASVEQKIEVTANGLASDGPPGLPPAAPVADSVNPIKGVGVVIKKHPGSPSSERMKHVLVQVTDDDGLDWDESVHAVGGGFDGISKDLAINTKSMGTDKGRMGGGNSGWDWEVEAERFGSKKGYQYYKAKGDMSAMGREASAPSLSERGGQTGEVTAEFCPLALRTPAGPDLALVLSYRSKVASGSPSSFGPGWTGCFDISVTPVPLAAGAAADQVQVCDGAGRCDNYFRQPDGSFTCDGTSRTGRFVGSTFTLTFADKGRWVCHPLDGSPRQGKIASIIDRNGNALTCAYTVEGVLSAVSSAFGQRLTFTYGVGGGPNIRVTDHTSRYCDLTFDGNGMLAACSSPLVGGQAPIAGPTTFIYSTGSPDPALNGNLLSCRDGMGRPVGLFTYSTEADPRAPGYDCVVSSRCSDSPAVPSATTTYSAVSDGVLVCDNDELGRLTETTCDRQHRPSLRRQFTGFCAAGDPVTPTSNRPAGQIHPGDPAFYQTTCTYNAQHCCTVLTEPDGLQTRCTYQYDISRAACPVSERRNERVCTLVSPGGEQRTIFMTYLPGFGAAECSGGKKFQPEGSKGVRFRTNRPIVEKDMYDPTERSGGGGGAQKYVGGGGKAQGVIRSKAIVRGWDPEKKEEIVGEMARSRDKGQNWEMYRTSLTTTYGQTFTNTYDAAGNCTGSRTPIAGAGCDITYNAFGQVTSVTTLNGPGSSFVETRVYDPASHFCSSVVRDPSGLNLAVSCTRDGLGRITSVTDSRGFDTLFTYNPLDLCVTMQSPVVGTTAASRNTTTCFYDAGGLPTGCDVEHRDATGALVAGNPYYSTRYVHGSEVSPFAISRFAVENRPVSLPPGSTDIAAAGLGNFDVCDFTFDAAGQCIQETTPAVCRAQPTNAESRYFYDERGLLYLCLDGLIGAPDVMTTTCDYTLAGDLSRCATLASAPGESPTELCTYDGFRRPSTYTDAMGNVETYTYDNKGYVTCDLYGAADNDLPGSGGDVLLSSCRLKVWQLMQGQNGTQAMRSRRGGDIKGSVIISSASYRKGGNREASAPSISEIVVTKPQDCASVGLFNVFLDVCDEDETTTVKRFTPGSAAAPVLEITTCDRSPAGLVMNVSTNGDLHAANTYDTAGRRVACTNGAWSFALTLDGCANVTACLRTDLSSSGAAPTVGYACATVFDALGRPVQVTEGSNVTACDYDSFGRMTRCAPPAVAPVHYDYDGTTVTGPFSMRTSCDVDGDGSLETLGSVYARFFGVWPHMHQSSSARRFVLKNQGGVSTTSLRSITDSNGFTTIFTRDALDRCVLTGFPDGTQEASEFNSLGHQISYIAKNGAISVCSYDLNGLPLSQTITDPNPDIVPVPPTTYHWNGLGDCTRLTQGGSDIVRAYDSYRDLVSESQNGHLVLHTYTHRGRTSTTYPGGVRYNEVRNAQGLLLTCSAEGAPSPAILSVHYQGWRPVQETRANGVVTTSRYRGPNDDAVPGTGPDFSLDACVQSTVTGPGGAVLSLSTYNRDGSQRLIRRETLFSGSPNTSSPLRRQDIALDGLGRLTGMLTRTRATAGAALVAESDVSYTLNLEGQRLAAFGGPHPGTYTSSSTLPPGDLQMDQYTEWPDGALVWDENGSLTLFSHGASGAQQLVYDACSRLVAVRDNASGAMVASYGYDACDRLISRFLPGQSGMPDETAFFIYDGSRCIQELGADGLPDVTFAGLGQCIISRNGSVVYPHGGGGASADYWVSSPAGGMPQVRLLTSSTGAPIEHFDAEDAGRPIFLDSEGIVRPGATAAIGPLKWLAPASLWCPKSSLFQCPGGTYSPDLGQDISSKIKPGKPHSGHEYVGHVSLIK